MCLLAVAMAASGISAPQAKANILDTAVGIVSDPLKLGHASDNILASVERINAVVDDLRNLEGQTNSDVEARLTQVQGIVDSVTSAVDRNVANLKQIIANAEVEVSQLEERIYDDVIDIIQRVECLAQDVATVQLQEAIADAINTIRSAHLNVKFLGVTVVNLSSSQVVVTDPDLAYVSTRDAYLAYIRSLGPSDPAYLILSKLANISRIAQLTRCSYQNNPLDAPLYREQLEYARLASPWTTAISVQVSDNSTVAGAGSR